MTNETTPVQAEHRTYEEFATAFYRENDYGPTARQAWNAARAAQTSAPKPTGGEPFGYVLDDPLMGFHFYKTKPERVSVSSQLHEVYATPQASAPATVSDTLQGAADWLVKALGRCGAIEIGWRLSIGHNRASRLYDAALATTPTASAEDAQPGAVAGELAGSAGGRE